VDSFVQADAASGWLGIGKSRDCDVPPSVEKRSCHVSSLPLFHGFLACV
jgi:hypothetical protein